MLFACEFSGICCRWRVYRWITCGCGERRWDFFLPSHRPEHVWMECHGNVCKYYRGFDSLFTFWLYFRDIYPSNVQWIKSSQSIDGILLQILFWLRISSGVFFFLINFAATAKKKQHTNSINSSTSNANTPNRTYLIALNCYL